MFVNIIKIILEYIIFAGQNYGLEGKIRVEVHRLSAGRFNVNEKKNNIILLQAPHLYIPHT